MHTEQEVPEGRVSGLDLTFAMCHRCDLSPFSVAAEVIAPRGQRVFLWNPVGLQGLGREQAASKSLPDDGHSGAPGTAGACLILKECVQVRPAEQAPA